MILGIKICFSSALRADRFLLLNEGLRIRSLRNTQLCNYMNPYRFYGTLLLVVVLSDYCIQLLFVSISPIFRNVYMVISIRQHAGLVHR